MKRFEHYNELSGENVSLKRQTLDVFKLKLYDANEETDICGLYYSILNWLNDEWIVKGGGTDE